MNPKTSRAALSSTSNCLRDFSPPGTAELLTRSRVYRRVVCSIALGLFGSFTLPTHAGPSAVAAGGNASHFIKTDGSLWGEAFRFAPEPVQLASVVSAVASSNTHLLFVKTDGTLWGLGANSDGQLGDGTTTYRSPPVQVASAVSAVAAGSSHSLFVKIDGTLWGMGNNGQGQLGIVTTTSRPTTTPVQIASGVRAVAAGSYHSLFIKTDGTLWGMGQNGYQNLGLENSTSVPVQIASGVSAVAAGEYHNLFIRTDGTLWAIGGNRFGQLGDGTTTTRSTPVQVATKVSAVAAGSEHSLFVKTDGTLWAMGGNEWSQLGDGTFVNRTSPVQVATSVRAAAGGARHSLFVKTDDTFWAMGYNSSGELGDGTKIERNTPIGLLAPTITTPLSMPAVIAGSSATFAVVASGTATLSYQWQKDGAPISGAATATYGISSAAPANAGSYSVVVSNWIGSTTSTVAILTVTVPPGITTQPSAQSVTAGNSATFTVTATGTSPLAYQWRKDGIAIFGATAATFTLGSVAASDVGSYTVIVSNSVSSLTSTAAALTLTPAAVAPSITTQPSAKTVVAGVSASLSVIASGTAPLSYQWKKNDAPIIGATAPTYNLSSASTADTGTYTVVVTNFVGSVTSTTAAFTVNTPPSITAQPVSQIVAAGASASFTVVASGTAPLTYQWRKRVSGSGNINVATGATLNLNGVTMSDAANYFVAVTNSQGSAVSNDVTLTVNTPPAITTQPSAQTVAAGSTLIQTVAATGSAPLSYQWMKDGTAISGAVGATFTRNPAAAADTGSYTVVVSNPFGSATSVAVTLNVNAPPVITAQPTQQSVTAGANASFNVIATGTAPLSYQWRKDGVPISGAVNPVLAIVSATTGSYTVIVTNSFGSVTSSSALLAVTAVATPPAITMQPSAQPATVGLSTSLAVIADGTAPLVYQWRKDGRPINGATTATYRIGSAALTDSGSYAVVVTNSAGTVTSTPTTLLVAPPATTFTQRHASAATDNNLWSFASGGGVMVAVGQPGLIYSSTNGSNWTQRASGTNEWLVGVAYGNGLFVAVGDNGRVLRSTDGVSWTYAANAGTIFRLNAVIYAAGRWVAAGESGAIVTSTDANTWTPVLSGTTRYLHGLAYGAGYFVTTGGGGTVLASNDGINWLTRNSTTTRNLEACVFVSNHFLAVGEAGEAIIAYGPGGAANWNNYSLYKPNTTSVLRGLAAGPGAIIAVTESGVIFSTPSIFNSWTQIPSTNANVLLTAGFAQDTFFALGFAALILQSDPVYDGRLSNLSTRGRAGAGADVLISGFVVRGNAPKQMLIRAAGPALTQFGITGALERPVLALFDGAGKPITANTGWGTAANVGAIRTAAIDIGAFPFAENSADSALLVPLSPGGYTAQVSGVAGTTGTTLIETYDLDNSVRMPSRLVNISSRGVVGTDQNIIIPGIATDGSSARLLLVRAIGPALDAFGVAGTLIDPQITVTRSTNPAPLAANDNWNVQTGANNNTFTAADIRDYTARAGAFTLPENSRDAALLFTTTPGANYTVQVSGVGNATGVALVEVYDVTGL